MKTREMRFRIVLATAFVASASMAVLGGHAQAATGNTTVTMTVQAGTLTVSPPASYAVSGIFSPGQTAVFTISNVGIADARGSGAGWTLSMSANDFSDGAAHFIRYTNFTVTPAVAVINDPTSQSVAGFTTFGPTTLSGTDTTPGTTQSATGTLVSAPVTGGSGSYFESPVFSVKLPYSTFAPAAGTLVYTSTYVFTAV